MYLYALILVTNPFTLFSHSLRIPPHTPPQALKPAPNGSDQRQPLFLFIITTCCFPLQNSPGATRTNQYFPRHLPNMQSSEKGPRPIICLFPQQVVYLQNHYISDTKINKCVFPQLSSYLHLPRYVAPTCYTQVNELSDCHFSPQLRPNHQLHY